MIFYDIIYMIWMIGALLIDVSAWKIFHHKTSTYSFIKDFSLINSSTSQRVLSSFSLYSSFDSSDFTNFDADSSTDIGSSAMGKNQKLPWVSNPEPKSARERAQFKNKVPFSEEMYDTIKRAIELISERSNTRKNLSVEDAKWLKNAVELIIHDAHMYGPPVRPSKKEEARPPMKNNS